MELTLKEPVKVVLLRDVSEEELEKAELEWVLDYPDTLTDLSETLKSHGPCWVSLDSEEEVVEERKIVGHIFEGRCLTYIHDRWLITDDCLLIRDADEVTWGSLNYVT